MENQKKLSHDDYTVAWICPLEVEQVAALEMLDEEHQRLPQSENDHNVYNLGSIFNHNVVIAGLPTAGNCSAATVIASMRHTYPRLRFGLLVGIGGGVPTGTDQGPIRLGHIVVSQPVGQHSGAVQYDHGKAEANRFVRKGFLAPPPMVLLNAARNLQVSRRRASMDPLVSHLERIDTTKRGFRNFKRPSADQDQLYEPDYIHLDKEKSCKKCGCDASKRVNRDIDDSDDDDGTGGTDDNWLVVHRGTIASGEKVMRNGMERDALAHDDKILCFEMEAAGALNDFPCLVIRGISDYSDSHKNDKWHGYAAAVAAAYARELFRYMPVDEVKQCRIGEKDVKKLIQNTQQSADYFLDSRVKDWLRPSDASFNLVNASKLRHSDTGRWFLESDRYQWLKSTPGANLWLRGIPGCGKTVLSSTIIKDLQLNERTTGTAIVYFFFSFNDESKQTLDFMLRSLIFQLVGWDKSTNAHLLKLFESSRNGHEQPQTIKLEETFSQMVSESKDVIIVIDALDESKDRRDLLPWITSASNQTCRFILTSRSERDIEERFASWLSPNCTITLESDLVGDDIEAYVHYRLKEDEHLSRWKSMHQEITSTLVEKAAGMFRWVYCQLQELSDCLDKPAVRRMLQKLPKDLNETYDRILQKIPDARAHNAIKLLQLLTFSKRPLGLEELIDALATEPEMKPPFDAESRVSPPEAIIGYCASLVRFTTAHTYRGNDWQSRNTDELYHPELDPIAEDQKTMTIQLAHFSVREYLFLDRGENPYYCCFEERIAHAALTRISLAYLWTASQAQGASGDSSEPPLTCYATHYWMIHATIAGEEEETTSAWTRKIFTNNSFLQYWSQSYFQWWHIDEASTLNYGLYYASDFALHGSVKYLLSKGADPNARTGPFGYALQAASISGNVQIVKLLLDNGASVNAQGGSFVTALHAAAEYGNIDTLRLLLMNGANVDAVGRLFGSVKTALVVAAVVGHAEIVEALLMHGANVNARNLLNTSGELGGDDHYTALEAASHNGHVEVVKILLKHNAEIDARGPYPFPKESTCDHYNSAQKFIYGTPLQAASIRGHIDIVRILVKRGADINIKSGRDGYALHAALFESHTEVSQFLIESGADIHANGGLHGTTLHAAWNGHNLAGMQQLIENGVDINRSNDVGESLLIQAISFDDTRFVELLLENGADANVQGNDLGTALCAASHSGHLEIVQMLLHKGADVNIRGGRYNDALQASCAGFRRWNQELVRLLLDNGADVNAQGGQYGTALCAASQRGNIEVVRLLLASGAEVNAQRREHGTALYGASQNGRVELVRLLLDNGAEVNAQGGEYGTALCGALKPVLSFTSVPEKTEGFEETMQVLLDKGADPNARNEGDDTLLYMACHCEALAVVTMLLAYGADPNVQGGDLGTALACASYNGWMGVVQNLLDNGADVNSQGGWYGNALQSSCCPDSYVKNPDMIQLLLNSGAKINAQGGEYGTALCAASSKGDLEIVKLLLREGADVNAYGGYYGYALCAAAYEGHIDIVRVLLDEGARINAQGGEYGTALCAASSKGQLEVVELLLRKGADINAPGGGYDCALCAAAYKGHIDVVRVLLDNGASINTQGEKYGTALCAASSAGKANIVRLLLREGADVNTRSGKFDWAICAAAYKGHIDIVRLLLENGAVAGTRRNPYKYAVQDAAKEGNKDIAELLFERSAVEELKTTRANPCPGLKRSISETEIRWSAEMLAADSRDASIGAWGTRRHSCGVQHDAAYSQYSDQKGFFSTTVEALVPVTEV